jgi:hypothetical protein
VDAAIALPVARFRAGVRLRGVGLAAPHRLRVDGLVPAVAATAAAVLALAYFGGPYQPAWYHPEPGRSWGLAYLHGETVALSAQSKTTLAALDRIPPADDMVNIILMYTPEQGGSSYYGTLYLAVLTRTYGDAAKAWEWVIRPAKTAGEIGELIRSYPRPLRFFTDSQLVVDAVTAVKAADPTRRVEVIRLIP